MQKLPKESKASPKKVQFKPKIQRPFLSRKLVIHTMDHPRFAPLKALLDRERKKEKGWLTVLSDSKAPTLSEETVAAISAVGGSLGDPKTIYTFRLVSVGTIGSDGSGNALGYKTWDVAGYSEYTNYFQYLFSEVRLRQAILHFTPCQAGATQYGLVISTTLSESSVNPTNASAVAVCADSALHCTANTWSGPAVAVRSPMHPNSLWANMASNPVSGGSASAPFADSGCYGQFWYGNVASYPLNTPLLTYMMEIIVDFRMRS